MNHDTIVTRHTASGVPHLTYTCSHPTFRSKNKLSDFIKLFIQDFLGDRLLRDYGFFRKTPVRFLRNVATALVSYCNKVSFISFT